MAMQTRKIKKSFFITKLGYSFKFVPDSSNWLFKTENKKSFFISELIRSVTIISNQIKWNIV
jgi:hypothetical protein